jgi:hypothetical protein
VMRGLALLSLMFVACESIAGCAEGTFDLASDSRLPKWFLQPASGLARDQYTVTMASYAVPYRQSTFKLWDSRGRKIAQVTALDEGLEPLTLTGHRSVHGGYDKDSYPLYELSTAGEVTEVLEFKWMESFFHVNDDPAVRAQLLELVNKRPIESPRPWNPPH